VSPPRTDQQLEAVRDPGRDVFLRAGAGTGKTTVLVDRFCSAALDPEVGVERILAFTFTERAADQLRRRVRAELARLAGSTEDPERLELLREAEEKTERAWISTIHGFCRRLLAAHPAAAGIDPRFRVLDEPESDRLAERAFDAALDGLVSSGHPEALELAASNHRNSLIGMTRSAYDELRSQGSASPALPEAPNEDPPTRIAEVIAAAELALEACGEAKTARGLVNLERIARAAELDPAADLSFDLLEQLAAMRLDGGGKLFDEGEEALAYERALKRAREVVSGMVMHEAYEQLRELVARFGACYEDLKEKRSALDFEDLQLQAVAMLEGNDRLRERYRERFRHLLVDEFQDTNALQLKLIQALRGRETRLFFVGDEFQSIYGFRHADVEVYRREHERFATGVEPSGVALPLTGNFRAAPGVVAATNAIGGALLRNFEPLTAGRDDPADPAGPLVEMALVQAGREWETAEVGLRRLPDDPSPPARIAEAQLLAQRLRELIDAGEADRSEIVVLLRAFTHVNAFERAFTDADLDPYVVGGRGFWSQQQIEDMRALLSVIANPLDDEALFGALASPAGGGVMPDTLWLLRRAASALPREPGGRERPRHVWPLIGRLLSGGSDDDDELQAERVEEIPNEELSRVLDFARRVAELRERGAEGGLDGLIERAATAFGYDLATLRRDSGRERWANVRKLMRLAREYEAREGTDLAGFLSYLGTRAASRDREAEAATRAEGHPGVRVMTIHSAKGLEFDVVAVPDLGRDLQIGWVPLRVRAGSDSPDETESARVGVQLGRLGRVGERLYDYSELNELAAERGAAEEGRLAYVAATRAKRRLLLSGTFTDKAVKSEKPRRPIAVQLIRELLGGVPEGDEIVELGPASAGAPTGRLAVRVIRPGPGAGATLAPPSPPVALERVVAEGRPPLGRPPSPPALAGGLSYSALASFKRCGYRFYAERVLGISGSDEPAAASPPGEGDEEGAPVDATHRYGPGVAVHALLEWSARRNWKAPDAERIAAQLRSEGIDPAGEAEIAARAGELVGAWLGSPLREDLEGASLSAEVPFVLSVADTLVRGSIDLLAERPGGGIVVIDYKTDRLLDLEPDAVAERYAIQRDIYALAAAARGTPVETAYVFLEAPDRPVRTSFHAAELEAARSRVEAVLADLATGEFPVTDRPHRALCHDCPARERLCSHSPADQMRDDPDPPVEPPAPVDPPAPSAASSASRPGAAARDADAGARSERQMSLLGD
jgi:ATP-dependent helicase/nuclease subunit A